MSKFDDLKNTATDKLSENSDVASEGLSKAKDAVNEKTGGKYADQLDGAADQAKGFAGIDDDETPVEGEEAATDDADDAASEVAEEAPTEEDAPEAAPEAEEEEVAEEADLPEGE
ncbi:MAG: antitoxin [Micrococcaceae bacterium]